MTLASIEIENFTKRYDDILTRAQRRLSYQFWVDASLLNTYNIMKIMHDGAHHRLKLTSARSYLWQTPTAETSIDSPQVSSCFHSQLRSEIGAMPLTVKTRRVWVNTISMIAVRAVPAMNTCLLGGDPPVLIYPPFIADFIFRLIGHLPDISFMLVYARPGGSAPGATPYRSR